MLGKGWFPDDTGGLERYFRDLFERTDDARAVVVGPAHDHPPGVRVAGDRAAPVPARLAAYWRAARRDLEAASVVDAHFALYAALPVLAGRGRRVPLMVHFQGPWAYENVADGDASAWRLTARRRLESAVYRRAGMIVVLTGSFRRILVEGYGVSPWVVRVLAPGVDVELFTPGDRVRARERLDLEPEAFVVCCVRRLVPRMGLHTLLDAWSRLASEHAAAGRQLRLLIAGEGPLAGELADRAGEPHMAGVRVLGRVDDERLVDLYRAADVNLLPSIAHEGFGLTVLEAAACGTPSLVSRVGGLPEAVSGLGRDLVVAPGDAAALALRLGAALAGDLPAREATRAWSQAHSWAAVAARHGELFDELLDAPARRLRVVYLGHTAALSGGEIALLRLLAAMPSVQAHVILAQDGPLVGRLHEAGVSVEVLALSERTRELRKDRITPGGLPLAAAFDTARYVFSLARRLRALRPDLVHTNTLKAGVYGSVAARLAGLPVVWHVRDRMAGDYLPRPAVWAVRRLIGALPDVIVANSRSTAATLPARASRAGRSVIIGEVAPPSPPPADAREAPGASDRPFVAAMVGRITPWKGQHVFLEAFARAFPHGSEHGVLIGGALFGEERYERELRDLAQRLGLAERIEFRGFRDDVAAELDGVDVLVHASTIPEPFGQVVLEGIARGLPVIAADAGGPAEIIAHERTGLLYPPGDVDALAALLARTARDPQLRARLAAAGPQRARDYAPEAVADAMLDAYRRALGDRSSER